MTTQTLSLTQLADKINAISSLSTVAAKTLKLANNPNTTAIDYKHLIDQDYAMATRIIRISNSATYSPRTPINSTLAAILYIGIQETKNLLVTMALQDLLRKDLTIGPYSRQNFLRHSLSVAATTQFIATRRGLSNYEDAYLSGLLHDLGITLLDQHAHDRFVDIIASLTPNTNTIEAEHRQLGFSHQELGEVIASRWQLPPVAIAAIRYHHDPSHYSGPHVAIVHAVHLANHLCALLGYPAFKGFSPHPIEETTFQALSITNKHIQVFFSDLGPVIQKAQSLATSL